VLWLLMSPDQYHRLVHRRRWTAQKYQQWLAASITQLLFACIREPRLSRLGQNGRHQ
jgi:hypothetical protein